MLGRQKRYVEKFTIKNLEHILKMKNQQSNSCFEVSFPIHQYILLANQIKNRKTNCATLNYASFNHEIRS